MAETASRTPAAEPAPVDVGHPRGTLAIVAAYGVLLALGWLAMYFLGFLQRGAPRP